MNVGVAVAIVSVAVSVISTGAGAIGTDRLIRGIHVKGWRRFLYLWPLLALGPVVVLVFVNKPETGNFPNLEFYRVAAEVMPLLLIALLVEGELVSKLQWGLRVEFTLVILVAEAAAIVAVAEIFGHAPDVGGSVQGTGILAVLTGTGLLAAAFLICAAVLLRDRKPAETSPEKPDVAPSSTVSAPTTEDPASVTSSPAQAQRVTPEPQAFVSGARPTEEAGEET
jgi:hypothetical protein